MTPNDKSSSPDPVEFLNSHLRGWSLAAGVRYVRAGSDAVEAELVIDDRHRQPHGLVHGGIYCALVETACSAGAVIDTLAQGRTAVGLENSTSFLRAVREGRLRVVATPRLRGKRTQVWEAVVYDDAGREAAVGRVRLLCLEPGETVSGGKLGAIGV